MFNYWVIFYYFGITYLGDRDSPYPFTKEEMDRYNVDCWRPSVWLAYYRDHWYYFTAAAFVVGSFLLGFFGQFVDRTRLILLYNLLALFAHQIEEYILPGGGGIFINVALYGETTAYDRFPGNKLSSAWVNNLAYPFYISAAVYSDQIWLGLAQCYFGFVQVIGHGILMNSRANMGYNPGLTTALLLHLPIGIYYIAHVQDQGALVMSDWFYGLAGLVGALLVTIPIPIAACRDRESPYRMTPAEMNKFNMLEKFRAKGILKKDI